MAVEMGQDVLYYKRISQRNLPVRLAAAVVHFLIEWRRRGKQSVEDALGGVVNRLHVSYAPVVVDGQVRDMTRGTAGPLEHLPAVVSRRVRLAVRGLEVIE